jgi:hypothetical protein
MTGGVPQRTLWTGREWVSGFAWSPRGDEVWFTTEPQGRLRQARAVDVSGRARVLAQVPGALSDISREGGILITTGTRRSGIRGRAPGESEERELSWLEGSAAVDLSPEGGRVLFGEFMEGGGVSGRIYLRRTDGSPAVHLGDGYPLGLSPDGTWAAVRPASPGHDGHFLYSVDGGERRPLPGLERHEWPVQWSVEGGAVYVRREGEMPLPVLRVDVQTGRKELWKELMPPDRAGVVWIDPLVTPDGRGYVYTYHRLLNDLYLLDGLK